MIRTEDPQSGFRQRRAGIRRIRAGWSRAASSTRLLKEGVKTCGFDGRRDNVPADLFRFAGSATGVLSLSRLRRQLPSAVAQGRQTRRFAGRHLADCRRQARPARAKPLVSSAALPELCFAKSPVRTIRWSQGTNQCINISIEVFNQWTSMRGFEVRNNRTETKNSCLLNLWRQEFVLSSAAAAGCRLSLPQYLVVYLEETQPVLPDLVCTLYHATPRESVRVSPR